MYNVYIHTSINTYRYWCLHNLCKEHLFQSGPAVAPDFGPRPTPEPRLLHQPYHIQSIAGNISTATCEGQRVWFVCLHMCAYLYIPTYLPTYIPTYIRTYIQTNKHTYIHTYIHTYMHTYIVYMHTYIIYIHNIHT